MSDSANDQLSVIACCLLGGLETALEAVEIIPLDAFSHPGARETFRVIEELATSGTEINPYTVGVKWKEQNRGALPMDILSAPDLVGSPKNLPYHAATVVECWRKRRIVDSCVAVVDRAKANNYKSDQIICDLERAMSGEEIAGSNTFDARSCSDRMVNDLERRFSLQGKYSGIATGYMDLDKKLDGLQFGEQTVIAARPSMGKTALGLCLISHACFINRVPTLFVSLEMSVEALMRRLCSAYCRISMTDIRRGGYTDNNFKSFGVFRAFAAKAPLWITDAVGSIGINELCAIIRRRVRKDGIKLVVIDYLQKVRPSRRSDKRTYEIAEVSSTLRALAISTGTALVTLAQLNRENEKDKGRIPRLSDIGDSKQIEQDADTALLIHRKPDATNGDTMLIIAKQRDGETGLVNLRFNGAFCRFDSVSRVDDAEQAQSPDYAD